MKRNSKELRQKLLLPDAVPSVFPNLPKHFAKAVPERRSESTSKDARFEMNNGSVISGLQVVLEVLQGCLQGFSNNCSYERVTLQIIMF